MPWLILLAVIALPVIEIRLFIESADLIGVVPTILVAVAAVAGGTALLRHQGLAALMRARAQLDRGEVPVAEAFDAICLALAGVLLVLPGFLTDALALPLLLPPVRARLRSWLGRHLGVVAGKRPVQPQVIEADYRVIDPGDSPRR